jgi:hypothetical protein
MQLVCSIRSETAGASLLAPHVSLTFTAPFYAARLLPSETAAAFTAFPATLSGFSCARRGVSETVLSSGGVFFFWHDDLLLSFWIRDRQTMDSEKISNQNPDGSIFRHRCNLSATC